MPSVTCIKRSRPPDATHRAIVFGLSPVVLGTLCVSRRSWLDLRLLRVCNCFSISIGGRAKDLRIVCWYHKLRRKSLKHFSDLGFETLAGAYYDGDTLDNPRDWLEAIRETPGAQGIMYTTWQNKYELLGPFGDLVLRK